MEFVEKRKKVELISLPIREKKDLIIDTIAKNKVTVISGDTGCGKTTQVPQYILEHCEKNKQPCRIICTQPRRLAAISIAKRVSNELNSYIGKIVGYQVRMKAIMAQETKILFVTTGILLQRMIHEKNLDQYTHIILDEIHERDLNSDFSLVIIKHLLKGSKSVKLILMSATFDTSLFANYFSESSVANIDMEAHQLLEEEPVELDRPIPTMQEEWSDVSIPEPMHVNPQPMVVMKSDSAPVIHIQCKRYNVTMYYIDNLIQIDKRMEPLTKSINNNFVLDRPKYIQECVLIAVHIIIDIIHKGDFLKDQNSLKKTILVFVPGYAEIIELIDRLYEYDNTLVSNSLELIPVHSTIPEDDQAKMFDPSSNKIRKVIIATNIAESSITIPDVECILDFCLLKENSFNSYYMCERLSLSWASKANIMQRSGRTGRVGDGCAFRLVPLEFYNALSPYSSPEILRCQLDKLILQIKKWNYKSPDVILGTAIQPPKLKEIILTIERLKDMGALTRNKESNITFLGDILCELPCDINAGKMIIYSSMFGCMQQALILGSIYQQEKALFRYRNEITKSYILCTQYYGLPNESDDIMLLQVYDNWYNLFGKHRGGRFHQEYDSEKKFCIEKNLSIHVLHEVHNTVNELSDRLFYMGFSEPIINSCIQYNPLGIFTLKLWLAACYTPKVLKPYYENREKIMKIKGSVEGEYPGKTQSLLILTLNNNDEFNNKLKNEINDFGVVSQYTIKGKHLIIYFNEEKSNDKKGIMGCIKYARSYSTTQRIKDFKTKMGQKEEKIDSILYKLKPESVYEVKFMECLERNYVHFESNSILYTDYIPFTMPLSDVAYFTKDLIDKKGGKYCRSITKISGINNVVALLFAIYSPRVQLITDKAKTYYIGIDVNWYKTRYTIPFTHIMTTQDIATLNKIRHAMSMHFDTISNMCGITAKSVSIPNMIKEFLEQKKIPLRQPTRWDHLLNLKVSKGNTNSLENEKANANDIFTPIPYTDIIEDNRIFTQQGINEIMDERDKIIQEKEKIINNLERIKNYVQTNECELVCAACKSDFSPLKSVDFFEDSQGNILLKLNCIFGLFPLKEKDPTLISHHKQYNIQVCYGCNKLHPIAFEIKQMVNKNNGEVVEANTVLISPSCPVQILMPDLSYINITKEILSDKLKSIREKEMEMNGNKLSQYEFYCDICDEKIHKEYFVKHLRSSSHKIALDEFKLC